MGSAELLRIHIQGVLAALGSAVEESLLSNCIFKEQRDDDPPLPPPFLASLLAVSGVCAASCHQGRLGARQLQGRALFDSKKLGAQMPRHTC